MLDEVKVKVLNLLQQKRETTRNYKKEDLYRERRKLEKRIENINVILSDKDALTSGYRYKKNIKRNNILRKILVPLAAILGLVLILQFPISIYTLLALTIPVLLGIGANSLVNNLEEINSYNHLYYSVYGDELLTKEEILKDKQSSKDRIKEIEYTLDRLLNDEEYIRALESMLKEIEVYQDLEVNTNQNREQRFEELLIKNETINEVKANEIQKRYYK